MNIIHYNLTTTTKAGGVETFVWELARQQRLQGHQVTIIGGVGNVGRALKGVRVLRYPFVDRMTWRSLPLLRRHIELTKLLERISMLPAALPALITQQPTLIHIHKPYDALLGPLAHAIKAKIVYHGHGEDFFPGDRLFMRSMDHVLSCSSYNARTLAARYGVTPTVVYNGFDPSHFQPQEPEPDLLAQFGAASRDHRLILAVGRLQPWKGVQYAIEAMALLPAKFRAKLLIVGTGTYRSTLEALVEQRGLQDRVLFLGEIPHRELRRYYAIADVVLGTSFASETFGMALCEALACGRPVIASDWEGFQELVIHGETGTIVPRQDPAALADAIQTIFRYPATSIYQAGQGRLHVQRLFTWKAVAQRVADVYAEIVPPEPEVAQ